MNKHVDLILPREHFADAETERRGITNGTSEVSTPGDVPSRHKHPLQRFHGEGLRTWGPLEEGGGSRGHREDQRSAERHAGLGRPERIDQAYREHEVENIAPGSGHAPVIALDGRVNPRVSAQRQQRGAESGRGQRHVSPRTGLTEAACAPPYRVCGCGKRLGTKRGLGCHVRDAHAGKMPPGPSCPYCGGNAVYRYTSSHLYGGRDFGPVWECAPCGAWVGCHDGTSKPLGRLANADLRAAKIAAHAAFDPLWRGGSMTRPEAYTWLAKQLGIPRKKCHIGMFDEASCYLVAKVCQAWTPA